MKMHSIQNSLLSCFIFALMVTLFLVIQAQSCTSVCLVRDNHVIFGNNLDWFVEDGIIYINKSNVKKRGLWFVNPAEWVSKYASITTNQEGREFPSRGMNEAGLVIGEMTLTVSEYPDRDDRAALNPLQWIQYQLDNCATVDEVVATDKNIRIEKGEYNSHFFVCDKNGDCATIEWIDGKLKSHSKEHVPLKVLTNSPYAECIENGNDSSGRFAKAAAMLDNYKSENPVDYVFSMLDNVKQKSTKWNLVFDAKNLKLYLRTAANRNIRYVSLRDFDLSCTASVYILDINAKGKGNVFNKFVPYTQQANAKLVRSTFQKYESYFGPTPEVVIEQIITYPSTTQCLTNDKDQSERL
jgi:penicillin V acylase-like amidase (Ntn superfamily)